MKKAFLGLALSSLLIVGCSSAPKSSEVNAKYIPSAYYSNHSCDQLVNEAESLRRSIPALQAAVDKHRSGQDGVEVVTWVLFWPAAFLLDDGSEYSEALAEAKGHLEAVQLQLQTKDCRSETSS